MDVPGACQDILTCAHLKRCNSTSKDNNMRDLFKCRCSILNTHDTSSERLQKWQTLKVTMKGFFLTPGLRRIEESVASECCRTWPGQMSTFVTTKNTGTFKAKATPKCSLHMPTMPAHQPCHLYKSTPKKEKIKAEYTQPLQKNPE